MQIRIRSPRLELPAETLEGMHHKLRLALGRHASGIAAVQVTLCVEDRNPRRKAGQAWRCRAHLRMRAGEKLVIEDQAESVLAATAAVAWRLEHRLDRRRAADPRVRSTRGFGRAALR